MPPTASDPARWTVNAWNYLWSPDYGSKHWSVADPRKQGEDTWPVERADVSPDGMSVTLTIRGWRPVMSVRVEVRITGRRRRRATRRHDLGDGESRCGEVTRRKRRG